MRQIEDGTQLVLVVWGGVLGGIGITIYQIQISVVSYIERFKTRNKIFEGDHKLIAIFKYCVLLLAVNFYRAENKEGGTVILFRV